MKGLKYRLSAVALTVGVLTTSHAAQAKAPHVVPQVVPAIAKHHTQRALEPARKKPSLTSIKQLPKVWQRLAWCESRYQQFAVSPSGLHHGYFQIHRGFFKAKGINPRTASLAQQWKVAQYVYQRQGADAWSCSKEAGLT